MPTKAELQTELDAMKGLVEAQRIRIENLIEDYKQDLANLQAENEKFKRKVVKKALTLADENQWCATVHSALKRMGLSDYMPLMYQIEPTLYDRTEVWSGDRFGCFWTLKDAKATADRDYSNVHYTSRIWAVPGKGRAKLVTSE